MIPLEALPIINRLLAAGWEIRVVLRPDFPGWRIEAWAVSDGFRWFDRLDFSDRSIDAARAGFIARTLEGWARRLEAARAGKNQPPPAAIEPRPRAPRSLDDLIDQVEAERILDTLEGRRR